VKWLALSPSGGPNSIAANVVFDAGGAQLHTTCDTCVMWSACRWTPCISWTYHTKRKRRQQRIHCEWLLERVHVREDCLAVIDLSWPYIPR
jgi:hypothetical protein